MCGRRSGCGGDGEKVGQRARCEEGAFQGLLGGNVGAEANARDDRGALAFHPGIEITTPFETTDVIAIH